MDTSGKRRSVALSIQRSAFSSQQSALSTQPLEWIARRKWHWALGTWHFAFGPLRSLALQANSRLPSAGSGQALAALGMTISERVGAAKVSGTPALRWQNAAC